MSNSEWTIAGCYQVAPNIHRIPLPLPNDGLRSVNVYAISDGDSLTLIDAGWALQESRDQLETALHTLDYALADISSILVTHSHRDHYTQAVTLRWDFPIMVSLGELERPNLAATASPRVAALQPQFGLLKRAGADELIQRLRQATPNHTPELWEEPDEWVADGATTTIGGRMLTAIHTPGHTQGHLVFRDAEAGLLFAGDHVLPHITPSIGFEPAPVELPLGDYLNSLAAVRALPDTWLLPAHGPVTDSVHARIDELIEHHRNRLDDTAAAIDRGAATATEAASLLPWTRHRRRLVDMDPFNQTLAILETAAHLNVLVTRRELSMAESDGVRTYSR